MKTNLTRLSLLTVVAILLLSYHSSAQNPWLQKAEKGKKANFHEAKKHFDEYWKDKIPKNKLTQDKKIPKGKGYKQFKRWEWFWEPRVGKNGEFPSSSIVLSEWEKYTAAHPEAKEQRIPGVNKKHTSNKWSSLGPNSSDGGYAGVGRLNTIAFHPTNPNIFWVGSPAGGLWQTTNGGASWITKTDNLPVLGVTGIVIDYTNPNIMYIATGDGYAGDTYSAGILKSTDGGQSWKTTGLNLNVTQTIRITSLIMHPRNPAILLATCNAGILKTTDAGVSWNLVQSGLFFDIKYKPSNPSVVYASSGGFNPSAQIYRSTNGGNSWSVVTNFTGNYRIALAVTPANPSVVKALGTNFNDFGFGGFYTSTNSGASFTSTYAATPGSINLLGWDVNGSDVGGQGWYDLCLAISPVNENIVYAGGVNTWKSVNGGSSWTINTMWYEGTGVPAVHADKHFMAFHPLNPAALYQCNDGGLYKTTNGGSSWTDLSNGLEITQFYRLGTAATNSALTIVGSQDNGTKLKSGSSWSDELGGDGMECIIDYSNANILYGSLYYGIVYRSMDGGNTYQDITATIPEYGAWVTPYVMDPTDPKTLYLGARSLYKTTNRGNSWTAISPNLAGSELQSLAVAPANSKIIYTGTYYQFYKTTTGGTSWTELTLPSSQALTYVAVHPTKPHTVWATFSGYASGQKVYESTDGGSTWKNISGTLPNLPVNCVTYDKNSGNLYIGNDVGVFVRKPSASDWQSYNTKLPNVIVNELEIHYASGKLRAATFGRGLWEVDLLKSGPKTAVIAKVDFEEEETELFALRVQPNPAKDKVTLSFRVKDDQAASLKLYDLQGKEVANVFSGTALAGQDYSFELQAKNLKEGMYMARLISNGKVDQQKLILIR